MRDAVKKDGHDPLGAPIPHQPPPILPGKSNVGNGTTKKILDKCGPYCYTPSGVLLECHMKPGRDKVTIKIPRPLYESLGKIVEGSGFNSVTEFIVYILRDLISSKSANKEPTLSKEEIEIVKKRLKSLGYL